jgi:predicted transcriptional regulator
MSKTVKQIADELGVTKQAVHQKRKSKELSTALQPFTTTVDGSFTPSFTPPEDSEIIFLRGQVEKLQTELEKEREHNREKDKQLLDTLNKLAESQAALAAGQAADKQKALAEKIIEGQQQSENVEIIKDNKETVKIGKIFGKLFRNH